MYFSFSFFFQEIYGACPLYRGQSIRSARDNTVVTALNDRYKRKAIWMWHDQLERNDQMATKNVKSKSRRWTLQVFFDVLDVVGINVQALYTETTGEKGRNFYSS
jgi:hypothetical protein